MPKRHQNFVFFLQLICSIDCKLNLLSNYVIYSHFLWTQHLHFGIFSTNFTHIRWFGHIWKMNLVFLLYDYYAPFIFQAQILSLITNKSLIKYFNSKVMHSIIIISSHINTSLQQLYWYGLNQNSLSAKKAPKFRFFLQLICSIDCKLNLLSNYVIYSHFLWTQHLFWSKKRKTGLPPSRGWTSNHMSLRHWCNHSATWVWFRKFLMLCS